MTDVSYRDRVMGCWIGKAIGGTLGQSFEGQDGPLDTDFYRPVPTEMVPNDDLDLQVVWAVTLAAGERPRIASDSLTGAWLHHVEFPFNEYGVAKRNLREGLRPPETGSYDNWFTCGEGAAIRSELWACLAPKDPQTAARYAAFDAHVDHDGDGVFAAMFLAAMQSAAFGGGDVSTLLDAGLAVIPSDCGIARVVTATVEHVQAGLPWTTARERILADFGSGDFTDVRMNTGFVVLGLLHGQGDFEKSILITNNCGKDTDSSTASVGAVLGIRAPGDIPDRWAAPIGRDLVLSPGIVNLSAPPTLDAFTDLVADLRQRLDRHTASSLGQDPAETRNEASFADSENRVLPVQGTYYSLRDEHRNLDTWFLPDQGPAPEWPSQPVPMVLPGTWSRRTRDEFDDDLLMLSYPVRLGDSVRARIMVAATVPCRVWLDGQWLFGRDGGPMFPAPHMPRLNTYADLDLAAGDYELRVVLQRPGNSEVAEWVVAVADAATKEWIPGVFRDGTAVDDTDRQSVVAMEVIAEG